MDSGGEGAECSDVGEDAGEPTTEEDVVEGFISMSVGGCRKLSKARRRDKQRNIVHKNIHVLQ
jgi:hypothetical protein